MIWLFWASMVLVVWAYVGYPLALFVLSRILPGRRLNITDAGPLDVTVIIAAHNEASNIVERIENVLDQDYHPHKVRILVASDASTDGTSELVDSLGNSRVQLLDFSDRRGKASVQNEAVREASGQILVFTDVDTRFDRSFLSKALRYFQDPTVGCVTGKLNYRSTGATISEHEGLYWRYELNVRHWASKLGMLATGTGACLAVRKDLYKPQRPNDGEDCVCPLDVLLQGYRVVQAQDALSYDWPPRSVSSELRARIRMTAKNLRGTVRK